MFGSYLNVNVLVHVPKGVLVEKIANVPKNCKGLTCTNSDKCNENEESLQNTEKKFKKDNSVILTQRSTQE